MLDILRMLSEAQGIKIDHPRLCGSFYVRSLDKDDPLPDFSHSLPDTPLTQKEWIWVAFGARDNKPLGLIAAAPLHGIVLLVRIYAIDEAPKSIAVGMLRKVLADCKDRGYTRYALHLDLRLDNEARLARIVKKAGGSEISSHTLFHGPIEPGRW